MEIFDIVTEEGVPTGEIVTRKDAHEAGICHRTAHIWVYRVQEGRKQVLLQKRSEEKESFPGDYDTSSAGHIQAGDEPLESALRELGEELGIYADPKDLEFAGTFRIRYDKEFNGKMFRDNEISFVYAYGLPVDEKKLVLQEEEVDGVEWFDLQQVWRACITGERVVEINGKTERFCVPFGGLKVIRDYLRTKLGYQFWGWEEAGIPLLKASTFETPLDLYDALTDIWCEYTCAPRLRSRWTKENMTLGQCSITAFLVQDLFGGTVRGILRPGGNYHCYNEIDGHAFDLTSEQFGEEELDYTDNPEQMREVHFAKEEKYQRYLWLKKRVFELYGK